MEMGLAGKRALVTGSTRGIGFAIARKLDAEGCAVVVNGRHEEDLIRAEAALGEHSYGVVADIHTPEGAAFLARETQRMGPVDILVNNVGVFEPRPFFEMDEAAWSRALEGNLLSGARLAQAILPAMLERGWGRIVFIASETAMNPTPDLVAYSTAKLAVLGLMRGLATLTRGTSVTANAVLPGPTMTEGVRDFDSWIASQRGVSLDEHCRDYFETQQAGSLLQRHATPEEIANVVCFLASPLAAVINGAAMRADGGVLRHML